ncbi:hypothetical protein [Streptomyces sp. Tu 3180]|uniref:hypothetical protein n=1 Tax=Streptomyces sp. Tu 3180 TaxID=2682611 RepID=UPI00135CC073|nr:hypothetical protein [Streptomyces sp. Tu 3180]KAF3463144.1 hypothetical protein GL259_13630 [Streptomyces sp. Tu 3180]
MTCPPRSNRGRHRRRTLPTTAGARTATLKAAGDLHGEDGTQYGAVAAAWSAVNMGPTVNAG